MKVFLWLLVVIPAAALAGCSGKIINPVTDVCWSCLFPIRAAGVTVKTSSVAAAATDAPAVCTCGAGVNLRAGINLSFFEPLRTAEIVFSVLGRRHDFARRAGGSPRSECFGKCG